MTKKNDEVFIKVLPVDDFDFLKDEFSGIPQYYNKALLGKALWPKPSTDFEVYIKLK